MIPYPLRSSSYTAWLGLIYEPILINFFYTLGNVPLNDQPTERLPLPCTLTVSILFLHVVHTNLIPKL